MVIDGVPSGKDIPQATMILKVWKKKSATCYKMATETGGGILFITEGVLVCADNKVNLKK
jgi:hypothetical protein